QMTRREQGKAALLRVEREAITLEKIGRRNLAAKIAKFSPVFYQVNQAPGQNEFQQSIQFELLNRCSAVFELCKNQPAGGGLQRPRNNNVPGLANVRARVIDDDHRPVRQIADGLMRLAAFLDQVQIDFVSRYHARTESTREIGQIQNTYSLQTSDLSQCVVV